MMTPYAEWQRGEGRTTKTSDVFVSLIAVAIVGVAWWGRDGLIYAVVETVYGWVLFLIALATPFLWPTWLLTRPHRSWRRQARALLRRFEADDGEIAVRATVRLPALATTLGTDEGALCTEDGWLVFRGVRSEWAVRREDVELGRRHFHYRGPNGTLLGVELESADEYERLRATLTEWWATPARPGRPVLPPALRDPERRELRGLILGVLPLSLAVGLVAASTPEVGFALGWIGLIALSATIGWRWWQRALLRRAGAWK